MVETAVILVAGFGSRLLPLTETIPKCLVQVKGKPILVNTLDTLEKNGIKEVAMVVGHLGDVIKAAIGEDYHGMKINYIENNIYSKTNSMYSLWLAREYLKKGSLIIEGDSCSEEGLIKKVLSLNKKKSYWVLDKFTEEYDGSMSTSNQDGRIIHLEVLREENEIRKRLQESSDNRWKSSGIVKVTKDYGTKLAGWLDQDVQQGNTDIYYDLVIAKHLDEEPLYVCDITGMKWFEIDNFDDLKRAEEIFSSGFGMKHLIVITDGAADIPIGDLDGKTPFEVSDIPTIDLLAKHGKTGLMKTMYEGLPIGSIVANMALLGFDPREYYPNGRASFEAVAQEIYLGKDDIAFRCNLISLEDNKISDFTADLIQNDKALRIIDDLDIEHKDIEIYAGQSYRNILVLRNADFNAEDIISHEPHTHIGYDISKIMIDGKTEKSKKGAKVLNSVMLDSIDKIKELNKEVDSKADSIWLWSPSSTPKLPSFKSRWGISGAIVAGLDFMRGIGVSSDMEAKEIKGATGYIDTNLKEKFKYAKNFLRNHDLVYVHINAPDEEAHQHNVKNKIKAIELIDKDIIKPLKEFLDQEYKENYRIVVLPDHYTRLSDGQHTDDPVPYLIYGKDVQKDSSSAFNENSVSKETMDAHDLIPALLKKEIK